VRWQYEAGPGTGDSYFASYLGSRARVELRSGPKEGFVPEVYLTPENAEPEADWEANLQSAAARLRKDYPDLSIERTGRSFHAKLPKADRGGGLQALFKEYEEYVRDQSRFPEYERANLLAKYYVTTRAVALARGER
jgi:hypothetical protein